MSWMRANSRLPGVVLLGMALVAVLAGSWPSPAMAADGSVSLTAEQRALAFGQLPALWRPRISPDGSRAVMVVQPERLDYPVAVVHRFETGKSKILLASEEDEFDLKSCWWAHDERLLCRFMGVGKLSGMKYGATRLVAIDADGSNMRVLMQNKLRRKLKSTGALAQFQDRIADLLPEDRNHVLVEEPGKKGVGLSRLNIDSGKLSRVVKPRDHVRRWITDGSSEPRLRLKWKMHKMRFWQHRKPGESRWEDLSFVPADEDDDGFQPIGFGDDPARLLLFRRVRGRMALLSEDVVGGGKPKVVFAHAEVDVAGVQTLGPHGRVVAATWATDRPRVTYFDPALERVDQALRKALPGKAIAIADESWDRRVYLIFAYSDVDPGTWYRLDLDEHSLAVIEDHRPALRGIALSPMETIEHAAADGTVIPGYLTRPAGASDGPLPTIVLPHGGPESRDVWGFDWLAQYLAASGYVVFQTNYRGSFGYGNDWIGEGAFRSWRRVVSDIDTGVQFLIDEGIADPKRICALGWSYGGYAALLSALEHPGRYRCVVDIAGVADPGELIEQASDFLNADLVEEMISRSDDVLKHGSPVHRAKEFKAPVLIFHPDEDLNVDVKQGRKLAKALRKAGKDVEYIEYDDDEHGIWSHASRIDMLTRIGRFLEKHLAVHAEGTTAQAPGDVTSAGL